jgi:hypothetical protein
MSMRRGLLMCVCLMIGALACSKTEPQQKAVEYGDAVGIEFGDATTGRYLAAVAAEKGHSPEKGVPAIAAALHEAAKGCPTLPTEAKQATEATAPTLRFMVKGGTLEAKPSAPGDGAAAICMAKGMNGKSANLDAPTPYELTIQLMAKKAGE